MRKLVTVKEISSVEAHPNADRLDLVTIGGWQCIAKKGEFTQGSLCVYFEIDSYLPNKPLYEFMGTPKLHQGKLGHRVKTMKLRGSLSQGLALPIQSVGIKYDVAFDAYMNNLDISEMLEVTKYDTEVTVNFGGKGGARPAGGFPRFIRKTDQPRIQNLTQYFTRFKDLEFEETLKLDGSSMTIYKVEDELPWWKKAINYFSPVFDTVKFGVCSRNVDLKESETNQFWAMANRLNIRDALPIGYALQGELISPSIQKNHEKVKEDDYYVFDVYDIKLQKYLPSAERDEFVKRLDKVKQVPVVNSDIAIFQLCENIEDMQQWVEGESINPGTVSEGRVYKCTTNAELTFKCISNKYLLKKG